MDHEVFKMLLAMADHLKLRIIANGSDAIDEPVTEGLYNRDKSGDYTYTIEKI